MVALGVASLALILGLAWMVRRVSKRARALHGREMTLLDHLRELRYRLLASLAAIGACAVALFSFGYTWMHMGSWVVPVPVPSVAEGFAAMGVNWLLSWAVPGFVEVYALHPTEAIMAVLKASMIGALVLASPVVAYQVALFVAPALHEEERSAAAWMSPVALGLYLVGVAFAAFVMVPVTLTMLYGYAEPLGARAVAQPQDILTFLLFTSVLFGAAFQTPLVMGGLAWGGFVSPEAMGRHWRGIVVGVLVMGAVLTDPNPVTQLLVSVPLVVLYGLGLVVARVAWRRGAGSDKARFS